MNVKSDKPAAVLLVYLKSKDKIKPAEQDKIKEWLSARLESNNIKLIIE